MTKTTAPKPFCFVLMPFDDKFDDIYRIGIKEACDNAGTYCERVDEQIFNERILDHIYNQITKADVVIADMTDRNPNVFYEVGYAHAIGKLTILLTKNAGDIPFDLKHFPHIVYGDKISVLRETLEKRIQYFITNPPAKLSDIKLGLELFLSNKNLDSKRVIYDSPLHKFPEPEITIFNSSGDTYNAGDFKIGILTSDIFTYCNDELIRTTKLPQGGYLHMLPDFPRLFPNGHASYMVSLGYAFHGEPRGNKRENITVRLFTRQGHRDFPITLRIIGK